MERTKLIAIVVVVVIAVAGVGIIIVMNPFATEFHYEREYPSGGSKSVFLGLHLSDCNLTITFVNDSSLMSSIDVKTYTTDTDFDYTESEGTENYLIMINRGWSPARLKSVDIILGTATSYQIAVSGNNLNTTIEYSNGVKLGHCGDGVDWDDDLQYQATGTIRLKLTEDVDFSEGGLDVNILGGKSISDYVDTVYLDIDLPDGLNGQIHFFESKLIVDEYSGWGEHQNNILRTQFISQPLLDIHVRGTTVRATIIS